MMPARVLVTGAAGFIGMHVAQRLLAAGVQVTGIDNLNAYYDVQLKRDRLAQLGGGAFGFRQLDVADRDGMAGLFAQGNFDAVVHLAAQAGVRHSLSAPHAFVDTNVSGFLNVLEGCRHGGVRHLVFASSSSVYGGNRVLPFDAAHGADHPLSLYAATKRANELMAHSYSHLYRLPVTGLRFFTAYGPWGRPDMALFLFTRAMLAGEPVQLYNGGDMLRDFTYVDDVAESVLRVLGLPPPADPARVPGSPADSPAPFRLLNVGNQQPVPLRAFVDAIAAELGTEPRLELLPMQAGDVPAALSDCAPLEALTGFRPSTPVREGVRRFVAWYRGYYRA